MPMRLFTVLGLGPELYGCKKGVSHEVHYTCDRHARD